MKRTTCVAIRDGDEWYCPCGLRWPNDEDKPKCPGKKTDAMRAADKLSKSQQAMLLALPVNKHTADQRTVDALVRRGLAERAGAIPNQHMPAWPYPAVRATALGKATRDVLLKVGRA